MALISVVNDVLGCTGKETALYFPLQCLLQFLLDYSLGKKLNRYLEFVVSQLE